MLEPVLALLAFIPAMTANSLAVLFGGGHPIDGNKKWKGKRILGDGKTWRGLFGGGLSSGMIGVFLQYIFRPYFSLYPSLSSALLIAFTLSFGALLGDIGASFIKRRRDIARGERSPLMDKYDFIIGSFILVVLVTPGWFYKTYLEGNGWIATLIIIIGVPILHRVVNILAYKFDMKDDPW